MRAVYSVILVTSLLTTTALTTGASADGGLAPGNPAGIAPAQSTLTVSSFVLGAGVFFGLLLATQSHGAAKISGSTAPLNPGDAAVAEGAALNTTK